MANSDKDILITPNTGESAKPKIEITGADNATKTITINDDGTISFDATIAATTGSVADGNANLVTGDAVFDYIAAQNFASSGASNFVVGDITGQTALTSGLASTDELVLSDAGALKRMDVSVLQSYMQSNLTFTTDTILTTENVQDIVGAMFTGNTETRVSATYEDGDGTIDLVVDDMTADTNTFRTVTAGGNTLGGSETLAFTAGSNVTISESGGAVTIASADTNTQLSSEQVEDIVGAMFSSNTETGITATYQDGDGTIDLVVGTLNQDTSGNAATATALENARTIGGTSFDGTANITPANATLAATVTVSDSTADTNFPVVFHDESNALLDDTGALRYNPSTGTLLVPNLNVAGTTTQVNTVTMEAANAVVFEGATSDAHETTLTITDPTADRTITLPNASGTVAVSASAGVALSSAGDVTADLSASHIPSLATSKITSGTFADARIASSNVTQHQGDITSLGTLTALGVSGSITIADDIIHSGDTNNKIAFGTDTQSFQTGGTARINLSDSGLQIGSGERVTTILDEDNMASDSATALATQQSIKAYVDSEVGSSGSVRTITAGGNTLATSETLAFTAGSNITISESGGAVTIASADTNTQLSTEQVQDIVGAMFGSNTETRISATYQDGDGTIDLVVDDMTTDTNTNQLTTFTLTGDSGSNQTIAHGNTLDIAGGDGIATVVGSTDTVTVGLDIDGMTDINAALVDADLMIVDDGAGGTNRKATMSRLKTYMQNNLTFTTDTNTQLSTEQVQDIAGGMFSSNTETGITATYQDADGTIDLVVGTLNQDTTGNADTATALETARNIGGVSFDGTANINLPGVNTAGNQNTSGTAALATTVTVTDSTANTNFPVVFHNESNGLLDDTGALRYNPSTGTLLVPNLNVAGTTTTVDTVTMEAANAIIFEGATSDTNETTLTITDPTADRTITLPDATGTVALTSQLSDTQLSTEQVQDIVGAMFSSNTETRISATYQDGDGTIDLVVDDMTTDTNTNQLTTFTLTGDSGSNQTIAHGNTLDIAGGDGIATVVGSTDTVTVGLDIDGMTDINAALADADLMIVDDGAGGTNRKATMSRLKTYMQNNLTFTTDTNQQTTFTLTGDSGSNQTIAHGNTLDVAGGTGVSTTVGATDTVTVAVDAAQTGITSIYNTGLAIGYASNGGLIDFGTDNQVSFAIDGTKQIDLFDGALLPTTDNDIDLGSSDKQFKDGFFDGTLEADAITVGGTAVAVSGGAFHDGFSDFVANEHIDHSGVTITAGNGLTGGGTIASTRTLTVGAGTGITVNTNDVAVTAAQTGITSVVNASLEIGRDADNRIKFGTDNQIIFEVSGGDNVIFKASGEIEASSLDISGDVDVDGTLETDNLTVGGQQGSDGQVLTSTGSGVQWEDAAGGGASALGDLSDAITTATSNVGVGGNALDSLTASSGNYNSALGNFTFNADQTVGSSQDNFVLTYDNSAGTIGLESASGGGASALDDLSDAITTATSNVGVGGNALDSLTASSGNYNSALGKDALTAVTTGDYNVGIGFEAGSSLQTGSQNVFIGSLAGGNTSTNAAASILIGHQAAYSATSVSNSVAIGTDAGKFGLKSQAGSVAIGYQAMQGNSSNSTGANNNIAVGLEALHDITTGDSNIVIGHQAGDSITTGSRCLVIGGLDTDSVSQNDAIRIGNGDGSVTWINGDSNGIRALKIKVKAVSGNTTLTDAQSGCYVYWTAGTLTLPATAESGQQYTIINNTGGSATPSLGTSNAIASGWTSHAAMADETARTYVSVATNTWIYIG